MVEMENLNTETRILGSQCMETSLKGDLFGLSTRIIIQSTKR